MPYPRNPFVPSTFIDVPDPSSPPPGAIEADAEELNKFGTAIRENREGLHLTKVTLNIDEFNAYDAIDEYPVSSESTMVVTGGSWGSAGVVKTFRDRASISSVALMGYDWQELKLAGTNSKFQRYALKNKQAQWLPNQSYVAGAIIQPATENGHFYRCTTGGISKATQPAWPTATGASVTETDAGGTNPTVTWIQEGTFWSAWQKIGSGTDPVITGILTHTPSAVQNITAATNVITIDARIKLISNTTAGSITLTSVPTIANGIDGQMVTIINTGSQFITLQDQINSAGNNLRLLQGRNVSLSTHDSIELIYLSAVGDWVQMTPLDAMQIFNPLFTGTLTGPAMSLTGNMKSASITAGGVVAFDPPAAQAIAAATDVITATSTSKLVSNTTAAGITLTSAPTIANGVDGQLLEITNTGTQNVILQDQGTLAGSNLRLKRSTIAVGPLETISLKYIVDVGDWVQIGIVDALPTDSPAFTGTITGPAMTLTGDMSVDDITANDISMTGIFAPAFPSAQVIGAATDTIAANIYSKLLSNTTAAGITLTSTPTIANGLDGQVIKIVNSGTQNIVLQDQGTLAGSNLRLTATTITLTPLDSVELTFVADIGDWIQTSSVVVTI